MADRAAVAALPRARPLLRRQDASCRAVVLRPARAPAVARASGAAPGLAARSDGVGGRRRAARRGPGRYANTVDAPGRAQSGGARDLPRRLCGRGTARGADAPYVLRRGLRDFFGSHGAELDRRRSHLRGQGGLRRCAAGPGRRGAFEFPDDRNKVFTFRVVGVPGDEIEERDGQLTINGWPVPRCELGEVGRPEAVTVFVEFLESRAYLVMHDEAPSSAGPWRVPAHELFVIGDNRSHSYDSRAWGDDNGAGVPQDHFVGRAVQVWWSTAPGGGASRFDRVGLDVTTPALPPGMQVLSSAFEDCLASRPSLDEATPPAP